MSKLGSEIIGALKEAKKKGLIILKVSPYVRKLRDKLKIPQRKFSKSNHKKKDLIG